LSGTGRSLLGACIADRPVGCDARRRGCVGYSLDLSCCSRSLGSLSGTGRSLLGACTADRPMRRSPPRLRRLRIGYALDPSCCSRSLGSFHRPLAARPVGEMPATLALHEGELLHPAFKLASLDHQLPRKTSHPPTQGGFKPVTARHRPTALTSVLTAVSRRLTLRDSELGLTRPALGADYYLTSLTSVMHREDGGF
jgi:hypothetical protein